MNALDPPDPADGDDAPPSASGDRTHASTGNWAALFHHSTQAVFLLSRRRRFRYVNRVWESMTGQSTESILGKICKARSTLDADPAQRIANALLPPAEVFEGRSVTVRRPVPDRSSGPPWWDVAYLPVTGSDGLLGILGTITVIGESISASAGRAIPPTIAELRHTSASRYSFELLRSDFPNRQRIAQQARLAAQNRHPVWIIGGSGSGKETLARIIHFQGITREQTFLPIDGAGLQPYLIRGMLFGKTGFAESGRIGTLYLKNASAMPNDLQRELLEWLEQCPVPPRAIVAESTERDAANAAAFLPEFAARLSVFEIRLPALGTPAMLASLPAFMRHIASEEPGSTEIGAAALALFQKYTWPGNFPELRETLRAAWTASAGKPIEVHHVPIAVRETVSRETVAVRGGSTPRKAVSLEWVLEQVERNMIQRAMQRTNVNRAELAERLGIARSTLLRRLKALGLDSE